MANQAAEAARARCERERELLASGERPAPRIKHKVQRTAAKALAVFFVLMLALTLLSRAADGITVARVRVEGAKTGILTNRTTAGGVIEAQGDLELTLPGGIQVNRIAVEKGARVQAGDVLLELDQAGIEEALQTLKDKLHILDLKIAAINKGQTAAGTDAVLDAQAALAAAETTLLNAQEDLERLTAGRATAEERTEEDLALAQADYDAAVEELARVEAKAREDIVKAAQEKVDAAAQALADVRESSAEAVAAAEQAVKGAEDQRNSAADQYYSALENYNQAKSNADQAQWALDEAVASGDEAAIAAARAAVIQAQDSLRGAQRTLTAADSVETSGSNAVSRAKETLQSVKEKWDAKVEKAETALEEAEEALAEARQVGDVSGEAAVIAAKSAVDSARRAVETARRGVEDAGTATEDQLLAARRAVESAERGVETARRSVESAERQAEAERRTQQNASRQSEIERLGYLSERRELAGKLEELQAVADRGGVLAAPVDGTVLEVLAETGLTQAGGRVAVLSRSDLGFEFSAKLPQKEAEELTLGTEGTLTYTQDGKSVELKAVVSALSMADEDGNVTLTASLPQGTYPTGASAKLEITHRSEQYASCLPLGALRGDGNDYFVLVLREKQTVMGVEQTVVKTPVTVLDQDSERVAVEGLGWDDQVVVSAGKPVSEGDRVQVESGNETQ